MPIPGDNGHPVQERQKQNVRIRDVALTGADLQRDINHFEERKPEPEVHLDGAIYRRGKEYR